MQHNLSVTYSNVRLRPIGEEDIEQMRVWRNLEYNRKWFTNSSEIDTESQKIWFEKYKKKENDYMFAIDAVLDDGIKIVGTVAIYDLDKTTGMAEYGRFLIGDINVKGKGIGRKALILCMHLGFKYMDIKKYYAVVYTDNVSALKVDYFVGFIDAGIKTDSSGREMRIIELDAERFYLAHPYIKAL